MVSVRTQSTFDMPCCICGSPDNIEMHHIKHIRKSPYSELKQKTYLQSMSLRNRKSIPVCRECHRKKKSTIYSGPPLNSLLERKTLMDLRGISSEQFIHKNNEEFFGKSLEEKGWIAQIEVDDFF
jgi:hypothetical protein